MAINDLSADRIDQDALAVPDRHPLNGRASDVVLSADWDPADTVDPDSVGLSRVTAIAVIVPWDGDVKNPGISTLIPEASVVRFIGS